MRSIECVRAIARDSHLTNNYAGQGGNIARTAGPHLLFSTGPTDALFPLRPGLEGRQGRAREPLTLPVRIPRLASQRHSAKGQHRERASSTTHPAANRSGCLAWRLTSLNARTPRNRCGAPKRASRKPSAWLESAAGSGMGVAGRSCGPRGCYRIANRNPGLPGRELRGTPTALSRRELGAAARRGRDRPRDRRTLRAPFLQMVRGRWHAPMGYGTRRGPARFHGPHRGAPRHGPGRNGAQACPEEALSSVNGRLIEAQESERARIARDLHDDIGQRLALLAMGLEQLKGLLPDASGGDPAGALDALQKQTAEMTTEVQALSHELHPPRLLHLGVVAAMRGFCARVLRADICRD